MKETFPKSVIALELESENIPNALSLDHGDE